MSRFILAVRATVGSVRVNMAAKTRSAALGARRLGTYREPDDVALVAVPGTSRSVPLYLLAPGATVGLVSVVIRTVLVVIATLTTVAMFWVAVGVGKGDGSARDSLAVLSVILWLAVLLAAEWSWANRPRRRPLNSDVDRW